MHEPILSGKIISLRMGRPRKFGNPESDNQWDAPWRSSIARDEVTYPALLGPGGFEGDEVENRKYHGGPDKAICAYPAAHYTAWAKDLPHLEMGNGAFGENFTIAGLTEEDVCIGDVWEILSPAAAGAERPQIQVSQPRQPCFTLARRWRDRQLPKMTIKTGRTGWYFRVLQQGVVAPASSLELVTRPHPGWSVAAANRTFYGKLDTLADLAALPELSDAWKSDISG